eukprot:512341-Pelagomonas_calceolata.AAC.2
MHPRIKENYPSDTGDFAIIKSSMGSFATLSAQGGGTGHLRLHDSQQAATATAKAAVGLTEAEGAGKRVAVYLRASPFPESSLTRDGEMEEGDE